MHLVHFIKSGTPPQPKLLVIIPQLELIIFTLINRSIFLFIHPCHGIQFPCIWLEYENILFVFIFLKNRDHISKIIIFHAKLIFLAGREYCVIVPWSFGSTIQLFLDTGMLWGLMRTSMPNYSHSLGKVEDKDDDNVDALSNKEEVFFFFFFIRVIV